MKKIEASSGLLLIALFAMGLFGLALRFFWPGDVLFIADEPLFLSLLDWHREHGTIPLTSFRGSSIPFPYGAGALWIYGAIQFFTRNLLTVTSLHTMIYVLGILSLIPLLRPHLRRENIFWVLALALTSPYLFMFSRHNWDNTFFVGLTGLALVLRQNLERARLRLLPLQLMLFSLLLGYLPNIHLMAGAVVLAFGISLLPLIWRRAQGSWLRGAVFLACATLPGILLLVPYTLESLRLFEAEKNLYPHNSREWWGDIRNFWWLMHKQMISFSLWKMKDQFKETYPRFLAFSGMPWAYLFRVEISAWIPKFFVLAYLFSLPVRFWKKKEAPLLELLCVLGFFIFLLVLNVLNIPTEPHYFHAVWWIPFVALGLAMERWSSRWISIPVKVMLFATIIINCAFIWNYMRYIHENRGMRNYFHSTSITDLQESVRELCVRVREPGGSAPAAPVKIGLKDVWVFAHPLNYFRAHMAECSGLIFEFPSTNAEAHWILKYNPGSEDDARLHWEHKDT